MVKLIVSDDEMEKALAVGSYEIRIKPYFQYDSLKNIKGWDSQFRCIMGQPAFQVRAVLAR